MKKRFSGPQIVAKLRQADVLIGRGKAIPEVCKELEISQQTYYRWRQKYGGMSPDMIKQFRRLQKENSQLKRLVADQALDISILKVAAPLSRYFENLARYCPPYYSMYVGRIRSPAFLKWDRALSRSLKSLSVNNKAVCPIRIWSLSTRTVSSLIFRPLMKTPCLLFMSSA